MKSIATTEQCIDSVYLRIIIVVTTFVRTTKLEVFQRNTLLHREWIMHLIQTS